MMIIIKTNGFCFFDKISIGAKRKMQKYYGVKNNTYAGKTIGRIYNQYFGNAYRVSKLYRKHYRKEFPSCKDFLICRFNLSQDLVEEIINKNLQCTNMEIKRDQIAYSFNYDDKLVDTFKKYVGGIRNED